MSEKKIKPYRFFHETEYNDEVIRILLLRIKNEEDKASNEFRILAEMEE